MHFNSMAIEIIHPKPLLDKRAEAILPALEGYPPSDRPMFLAGYSELCRVDLSGKRALEICGGSGKLAELLAESYPEAIIISIDRVANVTPEIEERMKPLPGFSYVAGNVFDLSEHADESFDLVWGQAALHHLAHDLETLSREILRILKPGGRFVFVFEPLGHNLLVAAIRGINVARRELLDESNLFFSQFESICEMGFSKCEVQVFNFLGYPMKALSNRFQIASQAVQKLDSILFQRFPKLLRYGANCNVIFTK